MLLIRIIYFLLIGWWLGIVSSGVAYLLCLSIIGLPIGLLIFNRLPRILTLKPINDQEVRLQRETVTIRQKELPFIIRALYFIFFGWHLTGFWVGIALFFCLTILGMPLGLIMLNHIPLILTLKLRY